MTCPVCQGRPVVLRGVVLRCPHVTPGRSAWAVLADLDREAARVARRRVELRRAIAERERIIAETRAEPHRWVRRCPDRFRTLGRWRTFLRAQNADDRAELARRGG